MSASCVHANRATRASGQVVCVDCGYSLSYTPAAKYARVKDMLHPPDGSEPLISREQVRELLEATAPAPATPAARPVRVGDMLAPTMGEGHFALSEVTELGGWLLMPDRRFASYRQCIDWEYLRHASDGAPIDVAASLEIARGVDRGDTPETPRINPIASDPSIASDAAAKRIAELETKLAIELRRGNIYSDKLGGLATENKNLSAENGRLRRDVERLERDAKRRR